MAKLGYDSRVLWQSSTTARLWCRRGCVLPAHTWLVIRAPAPLIRNADPSAAATGAVGRFHREKFDPELLQLAEQPVQLGLVTDVANQHGPVGAVLQGHPVERGLEALAEPSP